MSEPSSWERRARNLRTAGVICIPVLREDASRRKWADRVWAAMDEFPEYKVKGKTVQRVLGGFGAFGNPSSFHHPTLRRLRRKMKQHVGKPLFAAYARDIWGENSVRLEMLFDRVCVRCQQFGSVGKESWHRDIYDGKKYGLPHLPTSLPEDSRDEIFGGWLNLSDRDQKFVGLLETHKGDAAREAQDKGGGFAELSSTQIAEERVDERLLEQRSRVLGSVRTDDRGAIIVPPGHAVVFFQRLLHAVHGGAQPKEPQLRCFMGYRLTTQLTPLFAENQNAVIENFAVPRIPSGQIPPMYSQNHYAFFSKQGSKFRTWGERTFREECLYNRGGYSTPGSRDDRNVAANKGRYMPSLTEMGFGNSFVPYSVRDREVLEPEPLK